VLVYNQKMPITIPETWTGSEFVAKLNDNTLVYVSSPEQIRNVSPDDSISNSARLLVVLKNAIVANPPNSYPKYSLKLGSYVSATLSSLINQFMPNYITSNSVTLNSIKTDLAVNGPNFVFSYKDTSTITQIINTFFAYAGGTTYNLNAKATEWGMTLQTTAAAASFAAQSIATGGTPPPPVPTRAYPKLYLQDDIQITTETTNFGPSAVTINSLSMNNNQIINVANGSIPQSAATVSQLTTAISAVNSTVSSNQTTLSSSINAVKNQVDTILAGASTSLDTLKEIADYYSSLDTTQSLNLANQVTTLTGLVSAEQNRATAAELVLSTAIANEVERATEQEIAIVRKTEYEIAVLPTVTVFADGDQPAKIPDSLKASPSFPGLDGWYYKNMAANVKINWYLPKVDFLTGSTLKSIVLNAFVVSTASPIFVTIYTQKTGSGDLSSWYHSRAVYCIQDTSLLTANKLYHFYTHEAPEVIEPGFTPMQLPFDSFTSRGVIVASDKVLLISVSSNSAAALGSVETVLSKAKVVVDDGVTFTYTFSDMLPEINAINASASALATTVSSVSSAVSAEATSARSAEASLAASIQAETTARTAAITSVTNSITAEVSRAQAAEVSISFSATALTARVTALESQVEQLYQAFFQVSRTSAL
jgi:hypothetical protein